MSGQHTSNLIHGFIENNVIPATGLELVSCENKETIVFDEKEISWIYTFKVSQSDIKVVLTVSDPLYFCEVSFVKTTTDYFPLKTFLKNNIKDNTLEDHLNNFYDEKLNEEEYTLGYLEIFKNKICSDSIQDILTGKAWPKVAKED